MPTTTEMDGLPASTNHAEQNRDYDRLHDQCLTAMNDIESLKKTHAEILCRCEKAERDSEAYKEQYANTSMKFNELQQQYEEVIKDRDKLSKDYEEIVLLREQEKLESTRESPTDKSTRSISPRQHDSSSLNKTHSSTFDLLQKENDDLTYRFGDMKIEHDLLSSKYKKLQEDNFKLREQNDQLAKTSGDYDAIKQRCAFALMGFETALRVREEMRQQYELLGVKLEEANKVRLKMSRDISELQKEKDSAVYDYGLVMSERASVHQEIAKLQDDLGHGKAKELELYKEKEKACMEKDNFQKKVNSLRVARDKVLSEIQEIRSRFNKERIQYLEQIEQQRQENEMIEQQRNAAKKERSEAMVHRDEILKECFEVKQKCTRIMAGETDETKSLKDQFNKLCFELKAWKNQEVANQTWAFNERDKVIRERDKVIRALEIRKEDCAKLEEELRFYKEMAKGTTSSRALHKNLLSKENMLPSQDSAIDTDSLSYHIERIELQRPSNDVDYGFKINGGTDRPVREDTSIFVVDVVADSIAENKLKVNDCILHVNCIDLTNVEYQTAYDALFGSNSLDMKILRHRQTGLWSPLQRIEINSTQHKAIGLSIDSGLFIKRIEPGSAAAEEETLSIGDKILTVNGQSLDNMKYEDAKEMLQQSNLNLTVLKPSVSTTSSHRSLSVHNPEIIDHSSELTILEKTFSSFNEPLLQSPAAPIHMHDHYRSPSAPIPSYSDQIISLQSSEQHIKSTSVINRMSDDDIRKMLIELQEEQRRRTQLDIIAEGKPHRSDSFITAVKKGPGSSGAFFLDLLSQQRVARPISTHSSKASVTSSCGSMPPSPLNNISRSDPLALDKGRQIGFGLGGSSATNSNNSVNSTRKKPHAVVTKSYILSPHQRASIHDVQNPSLTSGYSCTSPGDGFQPFKSRSLGNHYSGNSNHHIHFSSVKATASSSPQNVDFSSDRYTSYSSTSTSKQGSTRSVGQSFNNKSCSSHGSLTSLDKEPPVLANKDSLTELPVVTENPRPSNAIQPISNSRSSSTKQSSLSIDISPISIVHPPAIPAMEPPQESESTPINKEEKSRHLNIEKGQYPLGITIVEGEIRGIFVSGVTDGSIAAKNGMKYGDQLLEYNGINLRTADYKTAVKILRDSERQNTVRILAQYNPHKMPIEDSLSAPSTPSTLHRSLPPVSPPSSKRGSGAPRCVSLPGTPVSVHVRLSSNTSSSSDHSKLTYAEKITAIPENDVIEEPRHVHIKRSPPSTAIGVGIIGGNNIGIFISDIQKNSLAGQSELKPGDQILLYNGKDMQKSTLEEATLELGKPTEVADLHVQYNPPDYRKAQTQANDSFYVRAQFDRSSHSKGELSFHKGDILHVTETLYKGQLGVWRASVVNEGPDAEDKTSKPVVGKVPSKGKAEQELLLRRSSSYTDDKSKNRKSLFRRSKKGSSHHAINHSRESSDSKADVESTVSAGASFVSIADEFNTYQYVKQIDSTFLKRPVVVLGAMAEPVCDKLVIDFNSRFARCFEVIKDTTKSQMQANLSDGTYIDYRSRKGDRYEVILPQVVKDFVYKHKQSKHCLLDVNPDAEIIDRIISLQLFPIIVFLKYKSAAKIKELRDKHYIKDKLTSKDAKEMHERFNGVENKFKHLINVTITCTNLNQVCKEINDTVDEQQQQKKLWVTDE